MVFTITILFLTRHPKYWFLNFPHFYFMAMNITRLLILSMSLFLFVSLPVGAVITPAPPAIDASSYFLMDYHSGHVLASQNTDQRLPPASLTKIMTVYVAASELAENHISLDDKVVVSEKAWKMPGSRMFIEVNREVLVRDLLNGIIIQSGNDASVALAEHISGDETVFADLMNQHAKRLGLQNTHYVNATGLPDEQHYTTAHDLAILASALIRDYPEMYEIHSHKEFTYNNIKQTNRNRLLWLDKSVDGIKTGHTEEAGFCLVVSAKRDDMRLISVVMGAGSDKARTNANQSLLNYGFRFYETRKLFSAGDIVTNARIWKGISDQIDLGLQEDIYVTIARGQFDQLEQIYNLPERIIAPVQKGAETGTMQLELSGEKVLVTPLYAMDTVEEAGLFKRLKDNIQLMLNK